MCERLVCAIALKESFNKLSFISGLISLNKFAFSMGEIIEKSSLIKKLSFELPSAIAFELIVYKWADIGFFSISRNVSSFLYIVFFKIPLIGTEIVVDTGTWRKVSSPRSFKVGARRPSNPPSSLLHSTSDLPNIDHPISILDTNFDRRHIDDRGKWSRGRRNWWR